MKSPIPPLEPPAIKTPAEILRFFRTVDHSMALDWKNQFSSAFAKPPTPVDQIAALANRVNLLSEVLGHLLITLEARDEDTRGTRQ